MTPEQQPFEDPVAVKVIARLTYQLDSLRAELAEAKADWNGLRDAVYGQNDYPSVNRADAELEANRIREKNRELQAQLISLQSNNAKLREALNSCSHEIPNLQKKLADGEQEGWEGSKRRMLLKKHIANLLASQPDNELRDRVRKTLNLAIVGSCTCHTKTPEVEHHDPKCFYRELRELLSSL